MPHAPLYLTHTLRQLETRAAHLAPTLMERAGLACAETAMQMREGAGKILVIAGPGNNGGDALVAARILRDRWYDITLVFLGNEDKLPDDANQALMAWKRGGTEILRSIPESGQWDLCIDGLFGIGLQRDLGAPWQQVVHKINKLGIPVLSIDVPSGLCAETGQVRGCAVKATRTIAFLSLKPGLHTLDGPDYCGTISVTSLGIDEFFPTEPDGWLLDINTAAACLEPRHHNSHKGTYGSAGIVGGATGMVGAAILAARAALKMGAGRVYAGLCLDTQLPCDWAQPELMLRPLGELLTMPNMTVLAIGPGLGTSSHACGLLKQAMLTDLPLVIDADALSLIAISPELAGLLASRQAPRILTPHPAEAGRLLGCGTRDVQENRLAAAVKMAKQFSAHVVLKGTGSVCATPEGKWFINPTGNAALASAGTGDVLTGILAAFLAQGLTPTEALLLGVSLHGTAADDLAASTGGPVGITAGEIIGAARSRLNRLVYR